MIPNWQIQHDTDPCAACTHIYHSHGQWGVKDRCSEAGCTCLRFQRNWGVLRIFTRRPIFRTDVCKCTHQRDDHPLFEHGTSCSTCDNPNACGYFRKDRRATRAAAPKTLMADINPDGGTRTLGRKV